MNIVFSIFTHYLYLGTFMMTIILIAEPPKREEWPALILCSIVWPLTTFFFVTEFRDLRNGK